MSEKSRILASIKAIVRELFPRLEFTGFYKYRVVSGDEMAVSCRPVATALGLPDLAGVPFRGAPGVAGELTTGAIVLVGFADGNPSEPFVGFVEGAISGGFVPAFLRVDASGELVVGESATDVLMAGGHARVLRDGDAVNLTGFMAGSNAVTANPGAVISLAATVAAPGPPPTGYSKVKA